MCGCFLHALYWGPGPQPRRVPWLGIEPVILWFTGLCSIHWATPARANWNCQTLFKAAAPLSISTSSVWDLSMSLPTLVIVSFLSWPPGGSHVSLTAIGTSLMATGAEHLCTCLLAICDLLCRNLFRCQDHSVGKDSFINQRGWENWISTCQRGKLPLLHTIENN